jgi:hypothetical protein
MAHRISRAVLVIVGAALVAAGGCGSSDDNEKIIEDAKGQNCGAVTYTPFDPMNHASQDVRVKAQADIAAKADEAIADPTKAAALFAEIEALYKGSADLQAKVQGRADDHFPGDPEAAKVGAVIDGYIVAAIERGKAATTATEADVAKQVIDKGLTWFFYLSVYHELVLGARDKYDEAFGYLGTGATNDPATLYSIAKTANRRDANNGTSLEPALFQAIIDGSCALDTRLLADGVETIDWKADEAYAAKVREIDETMQKVIALSVGHELFKPVKDLEAGEAKVKLFEGAMFFFAIEGSMKALGGQAEADAIQIGKAFRDAMAAADSGDATWQAGFDSDFIRDRVAAAFGVTVKA